MSLVDQVRKLEQQVVDRLKELEPLTREYDQLRKVAERLGLKYTPGSAKSDDGAKPSATRRRTAKPAAKRAARKPAKVQAVQSRGRSAAKPSAKPRGTRSTTAPKAKAKEEGEGEPAGRKRPRARVRASAPLPAGNGPADGVRLRDRASGTRTCCDSSARIQGSQSARSASGSGSTPPACTASSIS